LPPTKQGIPKSEVAVLAGNLARAHGGNVGYIYEDAIKGFSIQLPEPAAIALSRNPQVEFVEEDGEVSIAGTQTNATFGLDRIDQRDLPLNSTYNYSYTGAGVNAYVIDTGIRPTHQEFGGRASANYDAFGGNGIDCHGHGSHVAGTIGGGTYGVAKEVRIYGVRVLDCGGSGAWSGVIAGIDWVTANHVKPAVANMSLGGGAVDSVDAAVRNSISAGVTYVIAAGNSNDDASFYTPARVTEALTVGATDSSDTRASFSNYGSVLDLFAPGVFITSAWYDSDTSTQTISGTSMAAPHVAGVAALYLQDNSGASPATVNQAIINNATPNKVTGPGPGSPNRLLFSNPQYSVSLDGTAAYVNVPNSTSLNITGAITVEAAIKTNLAGTDQAIIERYNNFGAGTFDGGYVLRLVGSKLAFVTLKNGAEFDYVISSNDVTPGNWHHVAGVFDGAQLRVYIDGSLAGSKSSTFAPGTGTANLRIGAKGDDLTIKFNGLIDEARVTAAALYSANFNVVGVHELTPAAGTRGHWKFNWQTAGDSSGNRNNGTLIGGAGFSTDVP